MKKSMTEILIGIGHLKSTLDVEELGQIISSELFANIEFKGLNESIHDHIPAVYLSNIFLGLRVELSGFQGFGEEGFYNLHVYTTYDLWPTGDANKNRIDDYLQSLLKTTLKDYDEIIIR